MAEDAKLFRPPSIGFLRWLANPGPHVPDSLYATLLSRLFSSPAAVIMGVLNSLLLSSLAVAMNCGAVFIWYIGLDILLSILRVQVIRAVQRSIRAGVMPPVNTFLVTSILWCALQGAIAFAAMQTNRLPIEVLATTQIFGIIGPICARNYPAPRFALLLVCLCDLPFVTGALLSGNRTFLIMLPETPIFLYGAWMVIQVFQHLAVNSLKAELESRLLSTHDPLTGLLNRRGLAEALRHNTRTDGARLSILALDLDGFKKVNDTLGHHVGDALLKAVAGRLMARVRPSDYVVRLGGDEFVIIAKDLSPPDVTGLAERIITDITAAPYLIEDEHQVSVGVSIGFACAPDDGIEAEILHRRADAALYAAKASGKGVHRRHQRSADLDAEPRAARTANVADPIEAGGVPRDGSLPCRPD